MRVPSGKAIVALILGVVLLAFGIQFVPYGHQHDNPPTVQEPHWDSPQTRELARRACFDCHSNETIWPWYARYAPVSWLIASDVDEARRDLNFSDWRNGDRKGECAANIRVEITRRSMPPLPYRLIHPEARLNAAQWQQLITGLTQTIHLTDMQH